MYSTTDGMWTALHRAALDGHASIVKLLIDHGAAVDARDKDGDTPLHDAARNGHLPAVKLLVGAGAQLDAPNHMGQTPLQLARQAGRTAVADFVGSKLRSAAGGGRTGAL